MRSKLSLLLLIAMLLQLAPAGQAWAQGEERMPIDFSDYDLDVVDYTLPNGLRVVLAEDHSAPVVAVDIWYGVGGADDPENRSGFAHLFEHLMFEGSQNIQGDEWDRLLESIGARNNAYTANDLTAYWEVAPANQLPRVLWMESDRMATLDVDETAFETQRQVVIQEYNQRVANLPYGYANRRLFTQPFDGYVPYERTVIGSVEDLNAATLEEVQAFHSDYYRPNNATLVIVGDIDVPQTQAIVQAYFGDIPAGPEIVPILARYPLPDEFPVARAEDATGCLIGSEETLVDAKVEVPRLGATFVGPQRGTQDFYALRLLTDILSSGDSSRLERNILQKGLASAAYVGFSDYLGASILYAIIMPNGGDDLTEMRGLLLGEFEKLRDEGVSESELVRVKKQVQVDALTSFRESALDTAEWLQDYTLTFGDPTSIASELAMYEAVSVEDIARVAQAYLCDQPMHFQSVVPEGEEVLRAYPGSLVEPDSEAVTDVRTNPPELEVPDTAISSLPEGVVARSSIPATLGELSGKFPPFETFTLDNGLDVIFVEQHEVPKLRLELVVGGSNAAAPADKQGVADFLAGLVTKGTVVRSAEEIAESIESVGGSIETEASLESTSITVDALTTDTKLAFSLLSDLARRATFPQEDLEVLRDQTLTYLQQDAVNPSSMANRQFGRIAYGNHPYGMNSSSETVEGLTRDDVVDFYNTFYRPNNAVLVVVGDLTLEEVRSQAERAFRYWQPAEVPPFLDYPQAEVGDSSVIYLVDRPESEQATIQVGNRAINARNPDRYALQVVNAVLGGGSASRLFTNLREDKGYTYGVYSRFARPNDVGTFRVIGDFNSEHTADAIGEILYELDTIRSQPIPDGELEEAKGQVTGSFALAIEDPADFADQLSFRYLTGVPLDELNHYLSMLDAVSAEEAQSAAHRYIEGEQPIIVVVGDAVEVKAQLEEMGTVVVVDKDGNVME